MATEQQLNQPFLMKLRPLKPNDRFKQTMSYNFQHNNPKRQESVLDLPQMDFFSEPGIPAFMAPIDQYFFQKNPNFFKESFDRRLDRGNEEELKMLLLPKPPRKSRYCGICSQFYEEYYTHVFSETHKIKFLSHNFLPQLYRETKKLHTTFVRGQWKFVKEAEVSSDEVPEQDQNERAEALISERKPRSKSCESGKKRNHIVTDAQRKASEDNSRKENENLKTTKKEMSQSRRVTKKKSIKASLKKPQPRFLVDDEVRSSPNNKGAMITENDQPNQKLDVGHNNEARTPEIPPNLPCESKQVKRVYFKLKDDKEILESVKNKPVPLTMEKLQKYLENTSRKEIKSPKGTSTSGLELHPDPEVNPMRIEEEIQESLFKRRYPEKNLKRNNSRTPENEEELISCLKKVKLTDSQGSARNDNESQIKVDFQASQTRKWESLKNSFVDFIGELKGTVNKLYDFWRKIDLKS